jgi:rod shape-determining protein MreC
VPDQKQIRRRRAVLVLLVAISLILLTDYFGQSASSPLHGVQQGIADVLSPIQKGASKIFSPVRDITNWVSSTINAKSENEQLKKENSTLTYALAQEQFARHQLAQDQAILHLDTKTGLKQYGPVTGNVTGRDPSVWYNTLTVGIGSGSGVHQYDTVIGQGGLVGVVSQVFSSESIVTLLSSPKFSVGAMVEDSRDDPGILGPTVGNVSSMTLKYLPSNANINTGQMVVCSGFKDTADPSVASFCPAGIPIGTVSTQDPQTSVLNNQSVDVTPSADIQHISTVQILTKYNGSH